MTPQQLKHRRDDWRLDGGGSTATSTHQQIRVGLGLMVDLCLMMGLGLLEGLGLMVGLS